RSASAGGAAPSRCSGSSPGPSLWCSVSPARAETHTYTHTKTQTHKQTYTHPHTHTPHTHALKNLHRHQWIRSQTLAGDQHRNITLLFQHHCHSFSRKTAKTATTATT